MIHDGLDALLHPSARYDALRCARHRAFIASRLLGSLTVLAAFPLHLAIRGVPTALEATVCGWLIAPILLSWFLSRTGRYEAASMLSSLAVAGLVMTVTMTTGGIESFAAVWLIVVPLEASLSASRRVVAFASVLALSCACLLIVLGHFQIVSAAQENPVLREMLTAFGVTSVTIYATALAFGGESLSRTGLSLLSAEDRYRLLAANISDVISRHHRNGEVQFISLAAESVLGTPVAQLLGHGLFDRVHVADRPAYLTALSNAARSGEACSVEFRVRRDIASGREREQANGVDFIWVEMRCKPLEAVAETASPLQKGVVAVLRDVTERKNQEQALDLARTAAEQADASKTRFLAAMSHELRTPLNAIIGFSEMILQEDELMLNAARRKEYTQLINDSGQHLLSVVNGILDMSKLESGNFEITPEPFSPRDALLNCCDLLALKARDNAIDLVTRAPDNLPVMNGDPRAFRQIALNLVSNAIKFTERGGTVTVSAAVEGSRLVLSVADNGVGIAADDLKRIGDPFFQAGKTYERRHEGTGLGLSIVKSLVALHGGEMTVRSRVDEGTTVTVALPLTFTPPAPTASNVATLAPSRAVISDRASQVKRSA
jgi:two-component system, cell cycle sensor histidine kinase DivJ